MNAPRPGRVYVAPNAVKISLATRKTHPLLQESIELYTSFGTVAGNTRRRNRSQSRAPKLLAASSRSCGIVAIDSYTPNAMFQAIDVKIRNTTAISRPAGGPWEVATKNTRAAGEKTRVGTLWGMYKTGRTVTGAFLVNATL